ncbi:hypothetical protein SCG7086_AD_00430 [Chlamydiales bacterium SCGC AG-110-P3]|nr:hypothetical protein SCG7086_AD_00430 [Chlamydiales bacterium SCGC AG-110-P3]
MNSHTPKTYKKLKKIREETTKKESELESVEKKLQSTSNRQKDLTEDCLMRQNKPSAKEYLQTEFLEKIGDPKKTTLTPFEERIMWMLAPFYQWRPTAAEALEQIRGEQ